MSGVLGGVAGLHWSRIQLTEKCDILSSDGIGWSAVKVHYVTHE